MRFGEQLRTSSEMHHSRVVLAPDLTGDPSTRAVRAKSLVERLGDELAAVKLNFHVILPTGLAGTRPIADACARKGLPLIADIKLNDIEATDLETTNLLFENGYDAVIANPFVGAEEGLGKVISSARRRGKGTLLLVYMSHAGAREGFGLKVGREPLYVEFARRVRDWDADGAVVSARSTDVIRRVRAMLRPRQVIVSPGVGFQGGSARDAVDAGTDYAIVGRSIFEAPDPLASLRAINRSVGVP